MPNVFISHRKSDILLAEKLSVALSAAGHTVWLDEWNIGVGDSIVQRINEGLDNVAEALFKGLKDKSSDVRSAAESSLLHYALREFNSENITQAADIFRQMVAIVPDEEYKNDLAYCLIILGQYEEAAKQ